MRSYNVSGKELDVKVTCKKEGTEGDEVGRKNVDKAKKLFLKEKSYRDSF